LNAPTAFTVRELVSSHPRPPAPPSKSNKSEPDAGVAMKSVSSSVPGAFDE
jgi:hypothetical protein